jgi:glycosyltransferase involved in cell wall biosynthesis
MRLLIISSVIHYSWQGNIWSYGPYAREIDIWAGLFSEVAIAAPLRKEAPPGDCTVFAAKNVALLSQTEAGGETFLAKVNLLAKSPAIAWSLSKAIRRHDAVHVRCPGNLGLLGVLLAPVLSRRVVAKYAGQWNNYPGEPLTVRLQRFVLGSRYWNGPVTVYGKWPGQRSHVVSFFTSTMTREQIEQAAVAASRRVRTNFIKVLFVGRLSAGKNVDTLIEALSQLQTQGRAFFCSIIGEGPARPRLEQLVRQYALCDSVQFTGGLPYDRVLNHMAHSDVLVLASQTEGWPKAIAEGMAHGLICIGADRGFVPEMLSEGRGMIVPVRDTAKLAKALATIADDPARFQIMQNLAVEWARRYSIEDLQESLKQLLITRWNLQHPATLKLRADSETVTS